MYVTGKLFLLSEVFPDDCPTGGSSEAPGKDEDAAWTEAQREPGKRRAGEAG